MVMKWMAAQAASDSDPSQTPDDDTLDLTGLISACVI